MRNHKEHCVFSENLDSDANFGRYSHLWKRVFFGLIVGVMIRRCPIRSNFGSNRVRDFSWWWWATSAVAAFASSIVSSRLPPRGAPVGDTTADRQISAKCCSFSAVSAPIFASKYAFDSIFQNLPDSQAEIFAIWQNFANFATFANFCWNFTKIAEFSNRFFAKILRLQRCKRMQIL